MQARERCRNCEPSANSWSEAASSGRGRGKTHRMALMLPLAVPDRQLAVIMLACPMQCGSSLVYGSKLVHETGSCVTISIAHCGLSIVCTAHDRVCSIRESVMRSCQVSNVWKSN